MSGSKEATIIVFGFFAKSQDDYLDKLLTIGLTSRRKNYRVEIEREPIKINGQTGRRFVAYSQTGEEKL